MKSVWLAGSLPQAQIYGMTCSKIGSMDLKSADEQQSGRGCKNRNKLGFGKNVNDNSKKILSNSCQSKKSKEGDPWFGVSKAVLMRSEKQSY